MSRRSTVVEQKQHFLQAKKHSLSRGIVPSDALKTVAHRGGVELSVLKGALDKVNRELKQHSRRVYSRQMTEHVVEQIDKLYWAAGAPQLDSDDRADGATDVGDDGNALYQGDDLTQDEHIAKLPAVWDTSADPASAPHDDGEPVDQDAYMTAVTRLQDLSARRLTMQQKLNTYRTLLALLEPYRTPKENIQPNLVWRDSPLAPELTKTRTLAIRATGRVGEKFGDIQVPATNEDGDDVERADNEQAKLDKLLAGW